MPAEGFQGGHLPVTWKVIMKTPRVPSGGPASRLIERLGQKVMGVLQGFDRVRVQATLRTLYHSSVME